MLTEVTSMCRTQRRQQTRYHGSSAGMPLLGGGALRSAAALAGLDSGRRSPVSDDCSTEASPTFAADPRAAASFSSRACIPSCRRREDSRDGAAGCAAWLLPWSALLAAGRATLAKGSVLMPGSC